MVVKVQGIEKRDELLKLVSDCIGNHLTLDPNINNGKWFSVLSLFLLFGKSRQYWQNIFQASLSYTSKSNSFFHAFLKALCFRAFLAWVGSEFSQPSWFYRQICKEKLTISAPEHTSLQRFAGDHNPLQCWCLQRMPLDFSTQFLTNFKMVLKDKWVIGNKGQSLQLIVIFY